MEGFRQTRWITRTEEYQITVKPQTCLSTAKTYNWNPPAMAAGRLTRIVLLCLGVTVLIMTAQSRALLKRSKYVTENKNLRFYSHRRSRRGIVESDVEQCAVLTAPWDEATGPVNSQEQLLRIRVHSMSEGSALRTIFPEQPLFRFIRRVYRCCQMGYHCGSVKGIQGRLHHGRSNSFVFDVFVF